MNPPQPVRWSVWLMPSKAHEQVWQGRIAELASQLNGPQFHPHITLFSGSFSPELSPERLLQDLKRNFFTTPLVLTPVDVKLGSSFHQALTLTFHPHARLTELHQILAEKAVPDSRPYSLHPHLSLYYGKVKSRDKRTVIVKVNQWIEPVEFARLAIIDTTAGAASHDQVYAWKVLATD